MKKSGPMHASEYGHCSRCGQQRTILRIREMVGALPQEDVLVVVQRLLVRARNAPEEGKAPEPHPPSQSPPRGVLRAVPPLPK
jgi:hypothetical protein